MESTIWFDEHWFEVLREKIQNKNDYILFDEIEKCIEFGAYRAAGILIWICAAESIYSKIQEMSLKDKNFKKALKNFKKDQKDNTLIDQTYKIGYFDKKETTRLKSILQSRNEYAHPTRKEPSLGEIKCNLTAVVEIVLSKPSFFGYQYIEKFIGENLLKNHILYADEDERMIKKFTKNFISNIDSSSFDSILNLLFEGIEPLILDSDYKVQRCKMQSIIFTQELIKIMIKMGIKIDYGSFLENYKDSPNIIFSELKIWDNLPIFEKKKIFLYNFDFELNNLPEYDSINRFYEIYTKNELSKEYKKKFEDILKKISCEKLLKCNLDSNLIYKKVIFDLDTNNYEIQNPAIRYLSKIDLNQFTPIQQENLGRKVYLAADNRAFTAINYIDNLEYLYDNQNIPISYIQGLLNETLVNEKNEFKFKKTKFKTIILLVFNHKDCNLIFKNFLTLISKSHLKWNNSKDFKRVLDSLDKLLNSEISNIESDKILNLKENLQNSFPKE